ncbi:ubiquitin-like modifier-activating enzyme ATG7 isoform X1 [Asterias rubens]|uniref:ubiquitin-like modifier-activating enzyme ATG7 isoform X1 n=1 Tax=Asterias rubens TaxID=7604 RepID=UPI00145504CE|nr:ubiquitin-like modifier-activating enzyme ATG7 isoform X1 [Asterias rubens]XP_033647360.1 ubiquitin-like modifier-activating enzyme ATG7 isoform X1 [Asterias rubens]
MANSDGKDSTPKQLQFAPFSSALDVGFWHRLTRKKLEVYKLDDTPKQINGYYYNGDPDGLPSRTSLDFNSFDEPAECPPHCFPSCGTLLNLNTIDAFKSCDKKSELERAADLIWRDITSGAAISDPSLLSRFLLLTYADLKKYHFLFWFAFPALCSPENVVINQTRHLNQCFNEQQIQSLQESYDAVVDNHKGLAFFLVQKKDDLLTVFQLSDWDLLSDKSQVMLGFCDPCTLDQYPGWPLRNFLCLAAYHWADELPSLQVLCLRDRTREGVRSTDHSLVLDIQLPSIKSLSECPKCVGWEKNKNKMAPRKVDLSASMDPTKLAESSVDLNLKLMRWRLLPSLDLDKVAQTKCLLLGSGTLGCNVARCLMGWGVRTITLVDNSNVSYSNPVRQSLFEFEDSLEGGKPKAQTAANRLKLIFPGVNATGLSLSIPMPGHAIGSSEEILKQTKEDVAKLEELIDAHDVVFLLMDTRESRWLPTVIGASKRKMVMNAALGFDTYMVVRHGLKPPKDGSDENVAAGASAASSGGADSAPSLNCIPGEMLGCYFCNDVVAPGDSTKDRTLDQQCTVSRPGLSMVAAALVVELLVSLLQHPQGGYASADTSAKDDHLTTSLISPLGLVPHQIRGFLSRYHSLLPSSFAFDMCTACSSTVLRHYETEGFEFLLRAFNQPHYLEDLTGLTKLHLETENCDILEFSDSESITSIN